MLSVDPAKFSAGSRRFRRRRVSPTTLFYNFEQVERLALDNNIGRVKGEFSSQGSPGFALWIDRRIGLSRCDKSVLGIIGARLDSTGVSRE